MPNFSLLHSATKIPSDERDEEVNASEMNEQKKKKEREKELNFQRTEGKINIIQRTEKLD